MNKYKYLHYMTFYNEMFPQMFPQRKKVGKQNFKDC